MPVFSLLIKPASGSCNMRCAYCFYADVAANRKIASYGIMSDRTMDNVVRHAMAFASDSCAIGFQGGEPTLAGLDFYHRWLACEEKYNTKKLSVSHGIQTNGLLINREWAEFFSKNNFLVGLSLDGTKALHDRNRKTFDGTGTFSRVMRAAQLLESSGTAFNILTVVTPEVARNIVEIYGFYSRNRFKYQQYIPCLEPLGVAPGQQSASLTTEQYGTFLIELFHLWHRDFMRGSYVSIRYFDNLITMIMGMPPESCDMNGYCSVQNVVEADGSVYPCDFYVLDGYRMGNLNDSGFFEMQASPAREAFLREGRSVSPGCRDCRWFSLCRGGCRRCYEPSIKGLPDSNHCYCEAYKAFFAQCFPKMLEIVRMLKVRRPKP